MIVVPDWCNTAWGQAATFEMRQRLGSRPEGAPAVTQAVVVKEAEDVLKCYNRRGSELNDDLRAEEPYIRDAARREVAMLNAFLRRFAKVSEAA